MIEIENKNRYISSIIKTFGGGTNLTINYPNGEVLFRDDFKKHEHLEDKVWHMVRAGLLPIEAAQEIIKLIDGE